MKLDIETLRTLQSVAHAGGVTRAADQLALSQSAVSHKIRRLESAIDCQLLRRQPGMPLLTDEGQRLLDYAERIVGLHDEAIASLRHSAIEGEVRLGITEGNVDAKLVNILARFARAHPATSVRTHAALSLELLDGLAQGTFDVAVLNVFEADLAADDRIVGEEELVWVEARDHRPSTLDPIPYIAFGRDCFCRLWAERQIDNSQSARRLQTVLECRSVDGACNAVAAGLGVTLMDRRSMRREFRVIDLGLPPPPPIRTVVRVAKGTPSNAANALVEAIAAELQSAAPAG